MAAAAASSPRLGAAGAGAAPAAAAPPPDDEAFSPLCAAALEASTAQLASSLRERLTPLAPAVGDLLLAATVADTSAVQWEVRPALRTRALARCDGCSRSLPSHVRSLPAQYLLLPSPVGCRC